MESTSKAMEKDEGNLPEVSDAPPAYSSIRSTFGLEQLATMERVNVQHKNVTTEHDEVIFTLKRELTKEGLSYNIRFHLYDKTGKMVISFQPVSTLFNGRLEVYVEGVLASMLRMKSLLTCSPTYIITDAKKNKMLKIRAPKFGETRFVLTLKDMQGQHIGNVTKKWNGLADEFFADENVFEINFPKELEVQYKAAVIGFCVLIAQSSSLQYRDQ